VDRLVRVRFGPVELGDLAVGKVRSLTRAEVRALEQV
jgi:16S rRNA U516 pseudouridylate synthase RsuA-like enzyme